MVEQRSYANQMQTPDTDFGNCGQSYQMGKRSARAKTSMGKVYSSQDTRIRRRFAGPKHSGSAENILNFDPLFKPCGELYESERG